MYEAPRLRVALAGAGGLGGIWSTFIQAEPRVTLAVIVDPLVGTDLQSAWLSQILNASHFASIQAMNEKVDAMIVTAHSPAHAEVIRDGLERGFHVLVEKPFTTTLDDAEQLVALAKAKGLTLMVSQNYRFFPGSHMIRDLVKTRQFGGVNAVFAEFWCDWPGKPYQHKMRHVMGLEMAVHHFDLVRAMFDAEATGGCVREWRQAGSRFAGGDGIEAVFDMSGAQGAFPFTYSGSLVGKAPRTPWPGCWRIEFDGETIAVDTVEGRYGVYRAHADGYDWLGRFDGDDMLFNLPLAHFVDCILSGKEPWSSGRDNLGTLKMALGVETFGRR
jgi:predicted dehydrogenase